MGLFRKKQQEFNPFEHVEEADVLYEYEGLKLQLYFLDKYDFEDKVERKQNTYIHVKENELQLLLDRELYEAVPELYNDKALAAQYNYFNYNTSMKLSLFLLGGASISVGLYFVLSMWMDITGALVTGIFGGGIFMMTYFYRSIRKDMMGRGNALRQEMVNIFGEEKLDALLDKQIEIAREKGYNV